MTFKDWLILRGENKRHHYIFVDDLYKEFLETQNEIGDVPDLETFISTIKFNYRNTPSVQYHEFLNEDGGKTKILTGLKRKL